MDIFVKDKIKNIQNYIVELYNLKLKNGDYNAEANKIFNPRAFKNWCESFQSYSEEQIKDAIDRYHKSKNNKVAPKISQILSFLTKQDDNNNIDGTDSSLSKPICPISDWQEDFDYVLQRAVNCGIVFNPYWNQFKSNLGCFCYIEDNEGKFTYKTHSIIWKEELERAKRENPVSFNKISGFRDSMLDYTLAYRLNYLNI